MTYEDPQAVKGLASALDVRKQNTGGVGHSSGVVIHVESKLEVAALTELLILYSSNVVVMAILKLISGSKYLLSNDL